MYKLLPLLYACLVAAPGCTSFPRMRKLQITEDITKTVNLTLQHIQKQLREMGAGPLITVTEPSIEGLTSIIYDLELFHDELEQMPENYFSQIGVDVSSLKGKVGSLAQIHNCNDTDKPTRQNRETSYPVTRSYKTLKEVQLYMETLLRDKGKLEVC